MMKTALLIALDLIIAGACIYASGQLGYFRGFENGNIHGMAWEQAYDRCLDPYRKFTVAVVVDDCVREADWETSSKQK